MTFTESDVIFPSKKIYENIKELDDIILSLLYTKIHKLNYCYLLNFSIMRLPYSKFDNALEAIENEIKNIKKVKIEEKKPLSFANKFLAITKFILEASDLCNKKKNHTEQRFHDIAVELSKKLDIN